MHSVDVWGVYTIYYLFGDADPGSSVVSWDAFPEWIVSAFELCIVDVGPYSINGFAVVVPDMCAGEGSSISVSSSYVFLEAVLQEHVIDCPCTDVVIGVSKHDDFPPLLAP